MLGSEMHADTCKEVTVKTTQLFGRFWTFFTISAIYNTALWKFLNNLPLQKREGFQRSLTFVKLKLLQVVEEDQAGVDFPFGPEHLSKSHTK